MDFCQRKCWNINAIGVLLSLWFLLRLYLYGDSFNSDPLVFYRGGPIDTLMQPAEVISNKIGASDEYVIMSQNEWRKISDINPNLPPPLLRSEGKGPEGDAPLVLFKGSGSFYLREQ